MDVQCSVCFFTLFSITAAIPDLFLLSLGIAILIRYHTKIVFCFTFRGGEEEMDRYRESGVGGRGVF
jgi:hypothetical protein